MLAIERPPSALYSQCKNVPHRGETLHEQENAVNIAYTYISVPHVRSLSDYRILPQPSVDDATVHAWLRTIDSPIRNGRIVA